MKATTQEDIELLGRLRAIHEAMEHAVPKERELKKEFLLARRSLWHVVDKQWEVVNSLCTEDDT